MMHAQPRKRASGGRGPGLPGVPEGRNPRTERPRFRGKRGGAPVLALVLLGLVSAWGGAQGMQVSAAREAELREGIVAAALGKQGVPYLYGGASPSGFDCTGLVYWAYEQVSGHRLPRSTRYLAGYGDRISLEEALPGDILIFDTTGGPSHAGIYMGKGQMVHAASAGPKTGVIVSSMSERYYQTRFLYGRRVIFAHQGPLLDPTTPPGTEVTDQGLKLIAAQPGSQGPERFTSTFRQELDARAALFKSEAIALARDSMVEYQLNPGNGGNRWVDMILGRGTYGSFGFLPVLTQRIALVEGEWWQGPAWILDTAGSWSFTLVGLDGSLLFRHSFTVVEPGKAP